MKKWCRNIVKSVLLIAISFLTVFCFADESTNFIHLKAEINRQHTNATNVIEDSLGYLWLESHAGLLRFDGYDYKEIPFYSIFGKKANPSSLLQLAKDKKGHIWAVSKKGNISKQNHHSIFIPQYSCFNKLKEEQEIKSIHIGKSHLWLGSNFGVLKRQSRTDSTNVVFNIHSSNEGITSISECKNNTVWFSTDKGRIFKINTKTNDLEELKGPFSNPFNTIILTCDNNDKLWIGTELYGFFCYDPISETYQQYHNQTEGLNFVPSNMIIRIFKDSKGFIWLGTDGGGLFKVNPDNKQVQHFNHSKTNQLSLQSKSVIGIGETNNHDIWIFTNYGNINILPHESNTVGYHSGSISGSPTRILSVLKAKNGNLWIGTDGEGLTLIDKNGIQKKQFIAKTKSAKGLSGNYIQAITEDKTGNLWVGTYLNGLNYYDQRKSTFYSIQTVNQSGQRASDIRSLYVDNKNRIWVGSNIGLFVYSANKVQLAFFPYNKQDLQGTIAEFFLEDELGQFWIGMYGGGICLFDEAAKLQNSRFTTYKLSTSNNNNESSLIHGSSDKAGHLYLVNSYSKLLKFDIKRKEVLPIKEFTNSQLHKTVAIISIDSSNLWLSKSNGISHLDLQTKKDYFYTWKNGTIKGSYLSGSSFIDENGILYFGGIGGLNYFNPHKMKTSKKDLHLYINQLQIVNRDANDLIPTQLKSGVEHLKHLKLNHHQTAFSFQFAVINDHVDPNYYYAYRLKGFDKNWITTENKRSATYTNIPFGDYTFEVKAGTKRDLWDIKAKSIKISIIPPFWKRWWAYLIYTTLFLIISFFIIRYYIMWARLKHKLVIEELLNEKNKELYAMKMNFFAKMSHEIQTPLTLILSPIENMIERAEGNLLLTQRLHVIKNNAKRLSRIAMELMTIRNREMGRLRINASENNIISDINKIALSFREQARFKNVDFIVENNKLNELNLWYDQQKLEHIIYNLLANAFKFTPKEGKITLSIEPKHADNKVELKITDTGIGIPKDELQNIFNLFYQSKDGKAVGGTGIGLALTKELIQLHKGEIAVNSKITEGTTFTITLRTGKKHFSSEEIINTELKPEKEDKTYTLPQINNEEVSIFKDDKEYRNLLIVEDNFEMLLFLEDSFKSEYKVKTAQNGHEALEVISEFTPDIILSDVMMPIMDGITLCKKLKDQKTTRHIPLILLTTKNATSSKLEGLKYGAIEYINKPFNVKELKLKVFNILDTQNKMIEKYRTEILTESKEIQVESPDEKFIESVILEMEKNFEDPEFKLEELADMLNMSYSNIYRKFQSLTDKTLVDFMRSFRLKKAESLLINHNFSISEIAYQIGFNDPKYFSKCFKKEYGMTPKQYKQEKQIISKDNSIN
ncbi:response regulator [Marinifilum sp. N1E240]|uniref:hybrid sensor histidine kinase/response regulator transcription factor n=1 Tax=Marinifilum sp. N1E240 TaxID=2608082 RepID=UPI00128CD280|nr:ATP-binding protein [Marinifilum sp. N1E240]MPQ47480.1 response regulator [Marinifilum sp. N1E240]